MTNDTKKVILYYFLFLLPIKTRIAQVLIYYFTTTIWYRKCLNEVESFEAQNRSKEVNIAGHQCAQKRNLLTSNMRYKLGDVDLLWKRNRLYYKLKGLD